MKNIVRKMMGLAALAVLTLTNVAEAGATESDFTFNADVRYSQWVTKSRIGSYTANTTKNGFAVYDAQGNKLSGRTDGKTELDYVPGLVAKAIIENVQYYSQYPWAQSWSLPFFYSIADYGNAFYNKYKSTYGSLDDLNAAKVFFGLYELTNTGGAYASNNVVTSASTTKAHAQEALRRAMEGENGNEGIIKHNSARKIENNTPAYLAGHTIVEGGWWHKTAYENEMWLDGSYMGPALFAQLHNYNGSDIIGDDWTIVYRQIQALWEMCWNSTDKLLYHAFSAKSKDNYSATWAGYNPAGGVYHSASYWGRACGWYFLALIDILEQMDKAGLSNTTNYATLKSHLSDLAAGLAARQDATTGCWYQILDEDGTFHTSTYNNGKSHSDTYNYIESSASALFTAGYLKAMRLGYLSGSTVPTGCSKNYETIAKDGYKGLVNNFFAIDGNEGVHIFGSCRSAGLGNKNSSAGSSNYRDGSKAYYLLGGDVTREAKASNITNRVTEGKALGGFILAATEYERAYQNNTVLFEKDLAPTYDLEAGDEITCPASGSGAQISYQWYKDGSAVDGATSATFTPRASGSYYCKATSGTTTIQSSTANVTVSGEAPAETTYTVTFDATTNGGTCATASLTQASSGASITLPTATKSGYTFNGWYTAATGGTLRGAANASYTPTANETLYAQFTENSGTGGATESITWSGSSLTGVSGTNVTAGTATAVNGSTYSAGTLSISSNKIQTESKKHTNDSYWEDFSGGTQSASSTNATTTARMELPITIADGYTFNVSEVDFKFEQGGGGGPAVHVFLVQGSTSTWLGYTTAGTITWNTLNVDLEAGSAKLVFVLGVTENFTNGRQFKFSNIAIKGTSAQSGGDTPTPTTYTVSYNMNGHGEAIADVTNVTALPDPLPSPEATGYTFGGWYTDSGLNNAATAGASISADTELYAKWTEEPAPATNYTVKFYNGETQYGDAQTIEEGSTVSAPATSPTKQGYTFKGWALENGSTARVVFPYPIYSDVNFYAVWSNSTSGGGGEDEEIFSAVATTALSVTKGTTDNDLSDYATITGGSMYANNGETSDKDMIKAQSKVMAFSITNGKTVFKVTLNKALQVGDKINADTQTRTDTEVGLWLSTSSSRPSSTPTATMTLAQASSAAWTSLPEYTVATGDGICGETTFYIHRCVGKTVYFTNFTITREGQGDEITLETVSDYDDFESYAGEDKTVTFKRSFNNDKWTTLVLPFSATTAQVIAAFEYPNDCEFANIKSMTVTAQGTGSISYVTTSQITANTPILAKIKPNDGLSGKEGFTANEYVFTGVTVVNPESAEAVTATSTDGNVTMYGVYKNTARADIDNNSYFLSGGKFYDWSWLSNMTPFTAYIVPQTTSGNTLKGLTFEEDNATGIMNVNGNGNVNANSNLYNLAGQRVGKDYQGLKIKKGVKIIDNR